jgi:hypothetical protein
MPRHGRCVRGDGGSLRLGGEEESGSGVAVGVLEEAVGGNARGLDAIEGLVERGEERSQLRLGDEQRRLSRVSISLESRPPLGLELVAQLPLAVFHAVLALDFGPIALDCR